MHASTLFTMIHRAAPSTEHKLNDVQERSCMQASVWDSNLDLLCTPKSGKAAANVDRAKLLAPRALAAYSGSGYMSAGRFCLSSPRNVGSWRDLWPTTG